MDDQLRRRSVGAPAARSMLLTMLGEYLLPADDGVWQETLIGGLGTLGYSVPTARRALARSVNEGWLVAERHGRRSRVRLTPPTAAMLRTGAARIYSFGRSWDWDGRWLLVVLRVPEERREVRHQVRTRLAWSGFGSLGGGLWISPHVEREPELANLQDDDSVAELLSFRAEVGMLGDARKVVAEAWDLDSLRAGYGRFAQRFSDLRPTTPEAVFGAQTQMVHAWRRFPFLDPDLPADFLPAGWPRAGAHALFQERHAAWHRPAQEYVRSLEDLRNVA